MLDTDPQFDEHVRLLTEAGRLQPGFDQEIWAATNDKEIDALVERARKIVLEDSEQAGL